MRFVLNFDMDDTLVATKVILLTLAINRAKVLGDFAMANVFNDAYVKGLDIVELDKVYQDFIEDQIIIERKYMDIADPSNLILDIGLGDFYLGLQFLRKLYGERLLINICTHRGDNAEAVASTHNWLVDKNLRDCFDNIHSIHYTQDKLEYLRSIYKEDKILLVDDNPFGSSKQVRPANKEVLIYDGHRKLPCHQNQKKFVCLEDICMMITLELGI